jgi:HEPN domain-containing protein
MTAKFKTKDVAKVHYVNFRKKAEECFRAAQHSFTGQDWNAAAINVIHCCISACDAMCVYFLGKRHSGEDHNDAATLFKTIRQGEEINANANRILRILRMKNMAEYEGRLVYKSEAEKILRDCERFWEFVQGELPKG